MKKVFVRLRGGIGNQLFQYAMARRFALFNDAELIIDNISGFVKDVKYRRTYELEVFNLPFKTISTNSFFFYNYKRKMIKQINRFYKLNNYLYIEENVMSFDEEILKIKFNNNLYLDGFWQSYKYFEDVNDIIKSDLNLNLNDKFKNDLLLNEIVNSKSVSIHLRFFSDPNSKNDSDNININYYEKAIRYVIDTIENPVFYIFSDNLEQVKNMSLFKNLSNITLVDNSGYESALYDLWLMSMCKNNIIANSTFSWWAAWLNSNKSKLVICPDLEFNGKTTSWGFDGLIPSDWIKIY